MIYNQGNQGGGGATSTSTGPGNEGTSGTNTQGQPGNDGNDVLNNINTGYQPPGSGGYRETGFGNNRTDTSQPTSHIQGISGFDYGPITEGKDRFGKSFSASAEFWNLRVADRRFLSEDFIPTNKGHIKRLQNILGRTETGIMDAFTVRKYRALMGNHSNSGKYTDIFGYGRGGRNVGDIRRKIRRRTGAGKRSGPNKSKWNKFLDDPMSTVNEVVDFTTGIDLGFGENTDANNVTISGALAAAIQNLINENQQVEDSTDGVGAPDETTMIDPNQGEVIDTSDVYSNEDWLLDNFGNNERRFGF